MFTGREPHASFNEMSYGIFRPKVAAGIAVLTSLSFSPVIAEQIESSIHDLCIEARDYQGCVNSRTNSNNTTTIRNIDAGIELSGNSCPSGHAYVGSGQCQKVYCDGLAWWNRDINAKHDSRIAGKSWSCKGGQIMSLDGPLVRAVIDPSCPKTTFKIGWENTCEQR